MAAARLDLGRGRLGSPRRHTPTAPTGWATFHSPIPTDSYCNFGLDPDRVPYGLCLKEGRQAPGAGVGGPVGLGRRAAEHPLDAVRGRLLQVGGRVGARAGQV